MANTIAQLAEQIYREFYGRIDSKRFEPRKRGEIEDWLTEGDIEDMTLTELKQEWADWDAEEIAQRA